MTHNMPAFMLEWMARTPTCTVGAGPADYKQAQIIFRQHGLHLEGHHLHYSEPYGGGIVFVQDPDKTVRGAAVIKRFDEEAAEVRMAFLRYGFLGEHYATPLLSKAKKLAREMGYETLTTGNLEEDDPHRIMCAFYYESGFKLFQSELPRSVLDEGSYTDLKL